MRPVLRADAGARIERIVIPPHRNTRLNLVILDRDGVINENLPRHVRSPEDWRPIPGSLDAIARLNRAGWRVVVATNQSGIRRRYFTFEDLNRIHGEMHRRLAEYGGTIDAIFICPCHPNDDCECFKPRPGMLHEIAGRLHVTLDGVPFIGDASRDVEAAVAVGARPMLVRTGEGEATLHAGACPEGVEVCDDLASAVDTLLAER